MFVDITGKTRVKLGLHIHTTRSDGHMTPEEAAKIYIDHGYDAIALTDHWKYNDECEIEGLKIISGCEYDMGGSNGAPDASGDGGVYHIVGIGMTSDPEIPIAWRKMVRTSRGKAAETVIKIQKANGFAILAHPAWSLNTVEQLMEIDGFDGTEIYNAVSECGMSDRAYSSSEVDGLLGRGKKVTVLATDDVHYYKDDACRAAVMVEATDMETKSIVRALKQGKFYATQGPEIHITRIGADKVRVVCTPCEKIVFFSNLVWTNGRVVRGENLIEAEYSLKEGERYIRAEVTDNEGRRAWTNPIYFDDICKE